MSGRVSILAGLGAMVLVSMANSAELTGKVTEANGKNIKVRLDTEAIPQFGDEATVYFKVPGSDSEVVVGSGKVSEATAGSLGVTLDTLKGKAQKGQLVRIQSQTAASKPVEGTMTAVPAANEPVSKPPTAGSPAESPIESQPPQLGRLLTSDNFDKNKTYKENPEVTVEALNGELRVISKAIATEQLLSFFMRETREFYAEFAFREEPDPPKGMFGILFRASATGEAATGSAVFFRPQKHTMQVITTTGGKTVTDNTAPIAVDVFEPTKRTKVGVEVSEKKVRVFFNDKFAGSLEYGSTEQHAAAFGIYATTADDAHPYTTYYDDLRIYALVASSPPKSDLTDEKETGQAAVSASPSSSENVSDSAVWYRCDEGSGTTVADSRSQNLPLRLHGGLTFTTGQKGSALYFPDSWTVFASRDANDDSFNFGNRDFAIELLCRFDSFVHEQVLIEKFSGRTGPGWTLTVLDRNRLQFYTQGAGAFNARVKLRLNEWNRIAVFRRGPRLRMFVDQSLVLDQAIRGTINPSPNPLLLGKRNDEDGRGFPLHGALDEIRVDSGSPVPVNRR